MSHISFRKCLWIQLGVSLLCVVAVSIFGVLEMRSVRIEEREATLSQITDGALAIVKDYAAQADAGKISVETAQHQSLDRLRAIRYGDTGYFAVADKDVNILMHAFLPKIEHTNASKIVDPNGVRMWADGVHMAQTDGRGFIRYIWPKPGTNGDAPKLAYVAGYKPWGWTLLTGVYVDDINAAALRSAYRTLIAVGLVGALLSAIVLYINRGLRQSLGGEPEYAAEIARRIAGNDLSLVVETAQGDETSLLHSMQIMQAQLVTTIRAVKTLADSISNESSQIAAGNLNLSHRTEQQATALQETAASMDELNSAVGRTAENAQATQQVVQETLTAAQRGSEVVSQVVKAMEEINVSSGKIAGIVEIIEGIAFQTNILALNAAVEAARAGGQGRGFAVVAAEVRNLAQRSSLASKEITELIAGAGQGIRKGTGYAKEAGAAMGVIENAVNRATESMGEILVAALEQSKGIGQINEAISDMDRATQQNAALVEQAAAAASSLDSQAFGLRENVAVFILDAAASDV
jgi:methyl-accepting chemotaxis protein